MGAPDAQLGRLHPGSGARATDPRTGAEFQTTHWSAVAASAEDPRALAELLRAYWGPIYAFLRRSGRGPEAAADLTQEFIAQVVLERGLFARADPERGRFRTFLKAALKRFAIDQHRRATARSRCAPGARAPDFPLERVEPLEEDDPSRAFDRQWAATLLSVTLDRVRADCAAADQQAHWSAFEAVVIRPALGHAVPPRLEDLAAALGADRPEQVSSMIQTVRRKFHRTLRAVIRETVSEPGLAEEELAAMRSFLGV